MLRINSTGLQALLICMGLLGCRTEVPDLGIEDRRETVLQAIETVDLGALDRSFARLAETPHRRTLVVIQENRDGREVARVRQVALFRNDAHPMRAEVIQQDTAGNFDFGVFGRFVADDMHIDALPDYGRHLIPDQPAYLRPRSFEDYVYTFEPDTTIHGRGTRVVRILLRPEAEGQHQITEAVYYLDRTTNELSAFLQRRVYDSVLFTERSEAFFTLTDVGEGRRLPQSVRARTELRMPLTARRTFRVQIDYDYEDVLSAIPSPLSQNMPSVLLK